LRDRCLPLRIPRANGASKLITPVPDPIEPGPRKA
jgi:hypothetical protein